MMRTTSFDSRSEKIFIYEPQADITAYELAQLIPLLIEAGRTAVDVYRVRQREMPSEMNARIEGLDATLQRHFKERGTATQA